MASSEKVPRRKPATEAEDGPNDVSPVKRRRKKKTTSQEAPAMLSKGFQSQLLSTTASGSDPTLLRRMKRSSSQSELIGLSTSDSAADMFRRCVAEYWNARENVDVCEAASVISVLGVGSQRLFAWCFACLSGVSI